MYNDIYSMLRVNGTLTRPFSVTRRIRQGCPLSGLLYAISIEPFLSLLSKRLRGIGGSGCPKVPQVKLIAYADDVTLIIKNSNDVENIISCLDTFQKATSACINWEKCTSLLMGDWHGTGSPQLPKQCKWAHDGLNFFFILFWN